MQHQPPDNYVLKIEDVTSSDSGLYTCVASSCCASVTSSATIRVVATELEEYPHFAKRLESTDVSAGHIGHLEVRVTGTPKPGIKWFKNWIPLQEDYHIEVATKDNFPKLKPKLFIPTHLP